MKRMFLALLFVAATAAWCPASFAQVQDINAAVAFPPGTPLTTGGVSNGEADGVLFGAAIQGTLVVGTQNILTSFSGGPYTNKAVDATSAGYGSIVFQGTSNVFGTVGATAGLLNIFAGANLTTVTFYGNVITNTLLVNGTGTVDFKGPTNALAMEFGGDGIISLDPNAVVTGALTNPVGDNQGTLILAEGSKLTGQVGTSPAIALKDIQVVGGSTTTGVSATIDGPVFAHQFDLGPNTLNVTGALTITGTGLINTQIDSPTVYGNIQPGGASSPGSALHVNVLVAPGAVLPVGTLFNIVNAASGTGGIPISVSDPT